MVVFEDVQDVVAWLAPLDYPSFWEAVEPYRLTLQDRAHCDDQIASGAVSQDLVLKGLKTLARIELTEMFGLKRTSPDPWEAQYLRSVH